MIRFTLRTAVACAAIAATPALAGPPTGAGSHSAMPAGGMGHAGVNASAGGMGAIHTSPAGGMGQAGINARAGGMGTIHTAPTGGPSQAGIDARARSMGTVHASPAGTVHANTNSSLNTAATIAPPTATTTVRAVNSQGPANASANGMANANSNSVLARGAVDATVLPGLSTGLNVQGSAGTSLGTVSQIVTGKDGSIRTVIVTSATGQTYRLAPTSLAISGGVVTTTSY